MQFNSNRTDQPATVTGQRSVPGSNEILSGGPIPDHEPTWISSVDPSGQADASSWQDGLPGIPSLKPLSKQANITLMCSRV